MKSRGDRKHARAAAARRPKELRMLRGAGLDEFAAGSDELHGLDAQTSRSPLTDVPRHAAVQQVAAGLDRGAMTDRAGHAMLTESPRELKVADHRLDRSGLAGWGDARFVERRKVERDAALANRQPTPGVSAAATDDFEFVLA